VTTSFRVGKGIGIVHDATLALFEPINGALAESLWALVGNGAGIDELLEELSSTGLRSLGSFAMAQFEETQTRIVVRGSAVARIENSVGGRVIGANGVRTWVEEVVDGVVAVELTLLGADDVAGTALPFRADRGLVPADVLRQGIVAAPTLHGVPLDWADDFKVSDAISEPIHAQVRDVNNIVEPSELLFEGESAPPVPQPLILAQTPALAIPHEVDPGRTITAADLTGYTESSEADANEPPVAEQDTVMVATSSLPEAGDEYDEIYGRTMARSVHSAAVHPVSDEVDASVEAASADQTGLIQGVPSAPVEALGDHDGRTMTKAQIAAMKAAQSGGQQPAPALTMGGPTVQALMCPSQHANPPQLSVCRVCFAQLTTPPVHIARPNLGSLRFSNGTTVALDRPVLIGRNPKVEGGLAGEIPQLVRLDVGPGLSRTHASIRLEGWQVLLEDLNSANGTIVRLPGREPRRLHPSEPVLLEVGSDVDLGGEINCVFEAQ